MGSVRTDGAGAEAIAKSATGTHSRRYKTSKLKVYRPVIPAHSTRHRSLLEPFVIRPTSRIRVLKLAPQTGVIDR